MLLECKHLSYFSIFYTFCHSVKKSNILPSPTPSLPLSLYTREQLQSRLLVTAKQIFAGLCGKRHKMFSLQCSVYSLSPPSFILHFTA